MRKKILIANAMRRSKKRATKTIAALAIVSAVILASITGCKTKASGPKSSTAQYSTYQQIFCLNMLSNISGMYNYMSSRALLDSTICAVDSVLTDPNTINLIGHWQTVWGPAVYSTIVDTAGLPVAVNTMFIAHSLDDTSLYVIAIAGTNPASITAWAAEDMDVFNVINWQNVLAGNATFLNGANLVNTVPYISHGTYNGFSQLMKLADSTRNNITAYTYLQQLANSKANPVNIWVTGHSLGGALAPTMALYLNDTKDTGWGKNDTAISIHCLAVAGATPGDSAFSAYYNSRLGANTIRVWNSHDVVPHGYDTAMLKEVYTIYNTDTISPGVTLTTPDTIQAVIWTLLLKLRNHQPTFSHPFYCNPYKYTQLYPSGAANACFDTVFTSAFYKPSNIIDTTITKTSPNSFIGQLACQHIPSYPHYFGVDSFQTAVQRRKGYASPFFSFGFNPAPIVSVMPWPSGSTSAKK